MSLQKQQLNAVPTRSKNYVAKNVIRLKRDRNQAVFRPVPPIRHSSFVIRKFVVPPLSPYPLSLRLTLNFLTPETV